MAFREPRGTALGAIPLPDDELDAFLQGTQYCTLSFFSINGYPGATPINHAWDGEVFYIHCAKKGERYESLLQNPRVSISVYEAASDSDLHQPIPTHKSVVAYGDAQLLEEAEAIEALKAISLATHMPHKAQLGYITARLKDLAVFKVKPVHMTSRIVKFGGIRPMTKE